MTYYGPKELATSFRTVRANTIAIANDIPEDKYSFSPAPGSRTVAQTLVHIVNVHRISFLVHGENRVSAMAGLDFPKIFGEMIAEEQKPRTKAEIIELLTKDGDQFATFLEGFCEEVLAEQVAMPMGTPSHKSRFEMLLAMKEHEMHHRGQLMLVERLIGLTPHLTRQMMERMAAMQPQAAKA
jgi:uncharacterized damage-inducible protein DinB